MGVTTGETNNLLLGDDIVDQGYGLMAHYIPADQIDELIAAYAYFTDNLPDPSLELMDAMMPRGKNPEKLVNNIDKLSYSLDTGKEWHKLRTNYPYVAKPGGYSNRSLAVRALKTVRGLDVKDDPKEFYHYLPDSLPKLKKRHSRFDWGPLPPELIDLHKKFSVVHAAARAAMFRALVEVEVTHPSLGEANIDYRNLIASPLRLLFYHPGQGEVLAAPHYDKSVLSLQIAESHAGFRVIRPSDTGITTQQIDRGPDYGIVFPGHGYPESSTSDVLEPTFHDVINLPTSNEGRILHGANVVRWALVYFLDSHNKSQPTKSQMHQMASK